jgi:hypothetical protein
MSLEQTIFINLHEDMFAEIERRAASLQLSADDYIQLVLQELMECSAHG